MSATGFDDSNIEWYQIEGIDHAWYHVFSVDEDARIVDVLFRFAANEKVILHRHLADYSTFVVQGELRIYEPDGTLKEIRPTGSYVQRPKGGVHTEGGGDQDAIVLFSNRGTGGVIYEILDGDHNTVATLGLQDFKALMENQAPGVQPRLVG